MPTQRAHGGAALVPINLTAPGGAGLNTESEATILGPEWATVLTNAVFDSAGRAATRKGWDSKTTTAVSNVIMRIFEYIKGNGDAEILSSTDADIFTGVVAPTSIDGTLSILEGNIKFVNFNDKCIAFGTGTASNPSVYTGTGNFTSVVVASGTLPTSGIGTAAYGRLWVVDVDGTTIRYSALIDETKWSTTDGGGTIDMAKVWPNGQDVVVSIEEFAGDLIVFGRNQIVIWTDGKGASLGIDPTAIYISDSINGVGAVSQFGITRARGDLWFMSPTGIQSLSRVLQAKTTPTLNMTTNVQGKYIAFLNQENDFHNVTLVHSQRENFV